MPSSPQATATSSRLDMMTVLSWLQVAGFVWCLWLPVSTGLILYPAMALVLLTSLLIVRGRRLTPPRAWIWGAALYLGYGAGLLLWSVLVDNPGVVHQGLLWFGVPAIWGTWSLSMDAAQARRTLHATLATATLSGALVVGLALQAILHVDVYPAFLLDMQNMFFTISASQTLEMSYLGLSALIGAAALALTAAVMPFGDSWLPSRRWLVLSAAVLFVAGIACGRRGFMLVVVATLVVASLVGLVTLLRFRADRGHVLRYAGALGLAALAVGVLLMTPLGTNAPTPVRGVLGLPEAASDAPGSDGGEAPESLDAAGDDARRNQAGELLESWRAAPVFGHGLGSELESGFSRSDDRPWMFEMEPLQLLHSVGVVGLLVLLTVAGLLGSVVVRAWRTGRHRPALLGGAAAACGLLVASVTNPYLQAPAHGWALFLVLGLALATLRESVDPT